MAHRPHPAATAAAALALALAGALPGPAQAGGEPAAAVLRLDELLAAHPAGDGGGAVAEVARGPRTSLNLWRTDRAMPAHVHRAHEEIVVVERGRMRVRLGTREVDVGPGDVLVVPPGTPHSGVATAGEASGYSVFTPPFDGSDRVAVDLPPAPR